MQRRSFALVGIVLAGRLFESRVAEAQAEPRHAIDRLEPAERGSEWLTSESLDLRGRLRPSFGYVLGWARRSLVLNTPAGPRTPVEDFAVLHLGGSLVFVDRFRVGLDLPLQLYAGGRSAVTPTGTTPAPEREEGIGDLRLGADVRVFGVHRGPATGAIGVQTWLPTGERSQWTSDGVVRVRPRAIVAGELGGRFVWSAQIGGAIRDRSDIGVGAAAGLRAWDTLIVGPEIVASTGWGDPFSARRTPVEVLLGGHWLIEQTARVHASVGTGFGDGAGAPAIRALLAVDWAPAIEAPRPRRPRGPHGAGPGGGREHEIDTDRDGIPDRYDACSTVLGIATADPRTHGCPPDADGDGIDDLADACPTQPGARSSDPSIHGCPDRDRDHDGITNELDACPDDRGAPDVDPQRNGCPKAVLNRAQDRIELFDPIAWRDAASSELAMTPDNDSLLAAVLGAALRVPEGIRIRIEGHTDDRGGAPQNRKLAAARAEAVARWLADHGVARARLVTVGLGPDRPIATNETEAGRAENRRIELHLER